MRESGGSSGQIFREAGDNKFLRAFSEVADENAVNKIGAKMAPSEAVVFMLNSLTGLSLLTMPYGFTKAGLLLGSLIVLGCMVMSYITATFMLEALTIANALNYEKAEEEQIVNDPEVRQSLHKQMEQARKSEPDLKASLLHRDTIAQFKKEVRQTNMNEFKIRERVELGPLGQAVLTTGKRAKFLAALIYVMILSFTYGTASALVVTVNQSLGHTVISAIELVGFHAPDQNSAYMACVVATFFITLPLCFANLQNTKKFTMVIMCFRFLAIFILLVIGSLKSLQRIQNEGTQAVFKDVPIWNPDGFVAVFGNAVFLCGLHHYLPSMISPLEPQQKAPGVIIVAFSCCYLLLTATCATALTAFNAETHEYCSPDPGGNWCKIQPLYNLNFSPVSFGGGFLALFLLAYPAMAIASIPVAAITTRNTMGTALGIKPPDPEAPYTLSNILLTLSVVVPPFTVALITQDVQAVIQYVGGYAGLSVSFLCPLILLIRCRLALTLDAPEFKDVDRPLKSPFGNLCGYIAVVVVYIFALGMVTRKLFF